MWVGEKSQFGNFTCQLKGDESAKMRPSQSKGLLGPCVDVYTIFHATQRTSENES